MLLDDTIWWLVLAAALVGWFFQNVQHEGAHRILAEHWGATITKFMPWPVNADDKFSLAFWRKGHSWARLRWEDAEYDRTARGIIAIIPQAMNTAIMCFILGVRWRWPEMHTVAASLLTAWYILNIVDGGYGLGTFLRKDPRKVEGKKPRTDGWVFADRMNLGPWTCRLGILAWYLWFGFHLVVHPDWI